MNYDITFNKIIDDIFIDIHGGIPAEPLVSKEQLRFKFLNMRSKIIRDDIQRNGFNEEYMQELPCLELELVNKIDCCGILTDRCKILKSVMHIPRMINLKSNKPAFTVGGLDPYSSESLFFTVIKPHEARHVGHGEFTGENGYWVFIGPDNYLYILGTLKPRNLNLRGPFYDPRDVRVFNNCDGEACYTDDDPFPMPGHLLAYAQDAIKNNYKDDDSGSKD